MMIFRCAHTYLCVLLAVLALVPGCGQAKGPIPITEKRERIQPLSPALLTASPAQRFRQQAMVAPPDTSIPFDYELPAGWVEREKTQFRLLHFSLEDTPEAECFLSVLPGEAGGAVENINRWRAQLGQGPLTPEETAALPQIPLLGTTAAFVEADGTYTGMGDQPAAEGYRLYGAILQTGGNSIFVKMTGPAEALENQRDAFKQFCASLDIKTEAPRGGELAAAGPAPSPATPPFSWTAPESWRQTPDRPMRLVTFTAGPNGEAECFVTVLSNTGGGIAANINRWRGQMGLEPLPEMAIAELPVVETLGEQGVLLEAKGTYTGMGESREPGWMMLGLALVHEGQGIFVKMTGPEGVVAQERDNFIAFCKSIGH